MEHPFLNVNEISSLKLDEIQQKISELTHKLSIAHNVGNTYLAHQVCMALETYNNAMQTKLTEMMPKDDSRIKGKIDIS